MWKGNCRFIYAWKCKKATSYKPLLKHNILRTIFHHCYLNKVVTRMWPIFWTIFVQYQQTLMAVKKNHLRRIHESLTNSVRTEKEEWEHNACFWVISDIQEIFSKLLVIFLFYCKKEILLKKKQQNSSVMLIVIKTF